MYTDYKGNEVFEKDIDWIMHIKRSDKFPETLLKSNPELIIIVNYID